MSAIAPPFSAEATPCWGSSDAPPTWHSSWPPAADLGSLTVIRPADSCPPGARGFTIRGTPMVCTTTPDASLCPCTGMGTHRRASRVDAKLLTDVEHVDVRNPERVKQTPECSIVEFGDPQDEAGRHNLRSRWKLLEQTARDTAADSDLVCARQVCARQLGPPPPSPICGPGSRTGGEQSFTRKG